MVTGLGNGSTREIARPGIDAPPDPKDRLEVEIVGAGDTSRVTFDAKQLDEVLVGEQQNGLNRLISVLSEISGIPRAEMILTLYKDGVCDKEILKGSNPYKGSDVDAHLHEEFNRYLKTDAALQASESDHDVWWASKRKELDRQMVAAKSIKSLFVVTAGDDNVDEAEHQISFRGVKLIVAQEISHLWEPPEWSNFSEPAHNRLQFSLKLPKQRRFSALKGLEIECREIDGDWYILDERSGGTIVDQSWNSMLGSACYITITLIQRTLKTCGLKLAPNKMYELRARYVFEVPHLGERASAWSHKTGRTKPTPNKCRTLVPFGGKRPHATSSDDTLTYDSSEDGDQQQQVPLSPVPQRARTDVQLLGQDVQQMPPAANLAPIAFVPAPTRENAIDIDKVRLQVWLRKRHYQQLDFSRHYQALVDAGCDSIEALFALTKEDLQNVITQPVQLTLLLRARDADAHQQRVACPTASSSVAICPFTQCAPVDAVRASDGHVYERSAILTWFESHDRSPLTGKPLDKAVLVSI